VEIQERTLNYGVRIVKLVNTFPKTSSGFAIANQLIRSGTSIGANIAEAQDAASRADFTRGLVISLKEARETEYWLKIVSQSGLVGYNEILPVLAEVQEIIKILKSSVKKLRVKS
jgi:four helix bundle protein